MSATSEISDYWYVAVKGQQSRPLSFQQLCKLARMGKLKASHQVRSSGSEWMKASSIAGLFPEHPQAVSNTAEADAEEQPIETAKTIWFCRIKGKVSGPFSFDVIVHMVVKGELLATDEVRSDDGCWSSVRSISGLRVLLSQTEINQTSTSIPQQDDTALKAQEAWERENQKLFPKNSSARYHATPVVEQPFFDRLIDALISPLARKLIGGACLLSVVTYSYLYVTSIPAAAYLAKLEQTQADFDNLRIRQATPAEWDEYLFEYQADIASMLRTLERNASQARPDLQHLLWATRDALPKMFVDARENISENEIYFRRELQLAKELIE